jgi:hypothetical protein
MSKIYTNSLSNFTKTLDNVKCTVVDKEYEIPEFFNICHVIYDDAVVIDRIWDDCWPSVFVCEGPDYLELYYVEENPKEYTKKESSGCFIMTTDNLDSVMKELKDFEYKITPIYEYNYTIKEYTKRILYYFVDYFK